MTTVLPALVELLGEPVEDARMHGDLPLGYWGVDATARSVDFGGLVVVFGDWPTPYRDDGVMHAVSWGVTRRRTTNGTRLVPVGGISIGATVADLAARFGAALELPPGWCGGPVWYFAIHTDTDSPLVGGLAEHPYSKPRTEWSSVSSDVHVVWISAGEQQEDWGGVGFTC
jgi:hypothetical protein